MKVRLKRVRHWLLAMHEIKDDEVVRSERDLCFAANLFEEL